MRQLHPEAIAAIQSKVLFSKAEEQLLNKVGSVRDARAGVFLWAGGAPGWHLPLLRGVLGATCPLFPPQSSQPTLDTFQELLHKHPDVFYPSRTAKALQLHWQLMKQYYLLDDQTGEPRVPPRAPPQKTLYLCTPHSLPSCAFQYSRCPKGTKCSTSRTLRTCWMTAS